MSKSKIVFISAPYSKGDKNENVKKSLKATDTLIKAGFIPINLLPLAHMLYNSEIFRGTLNYDEGLKYAKRLLLESHLVLRLEGESDGADDEVELADLVGIPIYDSVFELITKES